MPHHLVGYLPLTETSSVGAHTPRAHAAIDAIAERGALPLVVGGTGLYLRAALTDLGLPPAVTSAERARWERFYDERGGDAALAELASRDARAAARLHANDRRRVVRALELAAAGASLAPAERPAVGRPPAPAGAASRSCRGRARSCGHASRERTEAMLASGAVDEVRALREGGVEPSPTASRILGLSQIGAYLEGRATLAECSAEITLRSGQYARRQETWARRIPEAIELAGADGPERNADRLLELIR